MDQLLAIRCFSRVLETGSFTRASDSLGMPKATVSKLVRDLEAHLGLRLLQRTTRRVSVTADGNAYYEQTGRLLRELEDIDSSFAGAHAKPRGKIRIDIGGAPARALLLPALPQFLERYPDIQIEIGVGDRSADLISDNIDCVVRGGKPTDLSYVARLLGTASRLTCASPSYLGKHGTPSHPNDLSNGHLAVRYQSALTGRPFMMQFQRGAERFEFDLPYAVSVNDGLTRAAAGVAGLGIIQTFPFLVRSDLEQGLLVPILVDWAPARYPFHVVYPPNRKLSNRVRVFIEWLVTIFGALD
jgi:DNA-binding transcriptional LysR family regulator